MTTKRLPPTTLLAIAALCSPLVLRANDYWYYPTSGESYAGLTSVKFYFYMDTEQYIMDGTAYAEATTELVRDVICRGDWAGGGGVDDNIYDSNHLVMWLEPLVCGISTTWLEELDAQHAVEVDPSECFYVHWYHGGNYPMYEYAGGNCYPD